MHNYPFTMNGSTTKLKTGYMQMMQAHVFRDWIVNHPKIMLPIVIFLLGSITYAVRTHDFISLVTDAKTTGIDLRSYPRLDGAREGSQLVRLPGVRYLQVAEREHAFARPVEQRELETFQRRRGLGR